ncbi:MAG: hypothetical protein NDI84_16585, partial [Steroidobacteraceae bacterium]|nr:hypothetical protein [Steroidobacteraceae bacterium]
MTEPRVLRVAIPGLPEAIAGLAGQGEVPRLPAAEWLLARGRAAEATVDDWRSWLLAGAGLGDDALMRFPPGPCAIAAAEGRLIDGTWARAEPVHLLTAIDHLQLAAPVPLPLDATESAALLETLNAHLSGSGFALRARDDSGWLCACPAALECTTVEPAQAVGRNLRDLLPSGRDAVRIRALVNELQMLLHDHPVNERRADSGRPVVNSVWLWGVGSASTPSGTVRGVLVTDDDWLAALWRLHGGCVEPLSALTAALGEATGEVRVAARAVIHRSASPESLQALEARVFAPVRAALTAATVSRVWLRAGHHTF